MAAILRLLKKTPECFAWKEHGGMYGRSVPDIFAASAGDCAFEVKTQVGRAPPPANDKAAEITIQRIREQRQAFKVTSAAEVAAILKLMEVSPHE